MIYQVTSSKAELEGAQARFLVDDSDGIVRSVYLDRKMMVVEMMRVLWHAKTEPLQWASVHAALLQAGGFTIQERNEGQDIPTNKKLALWCSKYEQHKRVKYKVSAADSGKMKSLAITEELLEYYLNDDKLPQNATTWLFRGKQSIANLVKYQNEVRTSMAQGAPSKFPSSYSAEYERKLDGPGITAYRKHLASLGLVPKRARDGSIMDYIPADHGTNA